METKEQLVQSIKEWVKLDNEIRTLQKEQQQRKKEKQKWSEKLIAVMKQNEIDCFDLKDGNIQYMKKNVKKPITKKMLLSILSNYYDGDGEKAMEVNDFILNNREEVVRETIVRKVNENAK